uniref:CBS domain-containing protein n=2 Tax=Zea mays TaxID=4577 RepID=A0A804NQ45_MAIZE
MDATLLLLPANCTAAASGRMRPRLPAGPHVASPGPSARPRTSIRASAVSAALAVRGLPQHASVAGQSTGSYRVGDVMTKREELHVVKPTTSVDDGALFLICCTCLPYFRSVERDHSILLFFAALEMLVKHRISGFPVIDDDWNLVGVVSDYDLLALDTISGAGPAEADIFPEVDSTWKTFHEIQKLLSKTNGKVIADVMTPAPLVVRETTNLEDAARLLLVTKYRRLPVVDSSGKLVGIITRGNVVQAALEIKKKVEGTL